MTFTKANCSGCFPYGLPGSTLLDMTAQKHLLQREGILQETQDQLYSTRLCALHEGCAEIGRED